MHAFTNGRVYRECGVRVRRKEEGVPAGGKKPGVGLESMMVITITLDIMLGGLAG